MHSFKIHCRLDALARLRSGIVMTAICMVVSNAAVASAQAQSQPPITRAAVTANAQAEFARMDANHDGILTREELTQFARSQEMAAIVARNRAIFEQLDTNHDGVLSREEFGRLVGPPPTPDVTPLYNHIDARHNGKVTRDEYLAGALANFDRLDTNHDGKISPDEARAARAKAQQGR